MKNLKILLLSTLITISTGSANANNNEVMKSFYETSSSPLIFNPLVKSQKNNEQLNKKYSLACYGCISESTGRPRLEYVQPHFRSNGTYVNGYYRS